MKTELNFRNASASDASLAAPLIMEAMNHECCQYFAGPDHTLDDFRHMMTRLIRREDSQYSYSNMLVAECEGRVAGILVGYNGADLHRLRKAFVEEALHSFGIDYSDMDDETAPGEYYLDTLCVSSQFRGRGIATQLLRKGIERGQQLGLPATGLLVDEGNPRAERLYSRVGFRVVDTTSWGSHAMRHMQYIYTDEK